MNTPLQSKSDIDAQKSDTSVDYTLLISRLADEIVKGSDPERCTAILTRQHVWVNLTPELLLKWASLAQMAGAIDTALAVYTHIHRIRPDMIRAWMEHIELLSILDKRVEAAQVVAAAQIHLSPDEKAACLKLFGDGKPHNPETEIGAAAAPFETMRTRQQAIERFMTLFSGREDCFARQWADPSEQKQGYVPVKRPMEYKDAEDHIMGRATYGIYLLRADSTVMTGVLDVDLVQKYRLPKLPAADVALVRRERDFLIRRIHEISIDAGMRAIPEFSGGKGFHFWYCFASPVPAAVARRSLEQIRQAVSGDVTAFNLEVFPKQDQLTGKGYGNLVKLPLGIHRVSKKHSWFLEGHDRTIESQLAFLGGITPIQPDAIQSPQTETSAAPVVLHPRFREWAETWPELYRLEQCCPPLAQIMASCRSRNTLSVREQQALFQTIGFMTRKKTLYIMDLGSYLRRDGETLKVVNGNVVTARIGANGLKKLILVGYVSMTGHVLDYLIKNRIETVFMTPTGRFRARLAIDEHKHVSLRMNQYRQLGDKTVAAGIAGNLVRKKIENMYRFLMLRARNYQSRPLNIAAVKLKSLITCIAEHSSLEQIRGIEGTTANIYFGVFSDLIQNPDFSFNGRNRRPPRDPVNALLSFVYTLLTNEVLSAIKTCGLDPYLGALHEIDYGRPSLACDLVEEYRSFLGDRLVLGLINRRLIKPDDFIFRTPSKKEFADEDDMKQNRPVEMKPTVNRTFIAAYEEMMNRRIFYPPMEQTITYRWLIYQQVKRFGQSLEDENAPYQPFIWES